MEEMDIMDWKLTLYPNEEEDEVTRLRRDEMEVNIAQRMVMLGYEPELVQEGNRDVRFIYKKPDPAQQMQQPPPGGGMPPPGGMPPDGGGMMPPGGGMPGGGMPQPQANPGQLPGRNIPPQLAGVMGGQASAGARSMSDGGPNSSPQNRTSMGAGSPTSSVQQRGSQPSPIEQAARSISESGRYKGA
tara:strand:- start:6 stop:566 length:561 start_codon:yes stop_codon:yes gene_type:complete